MLASLSDNATLATADMYPSRVIPEVVDVVEVRDDEEAETSPSSLPRLLHSKEFLVDSLLGLSEGAPDVEHLLDDLPELMPMNKWDDE